MYHSNVIDAKDECVEIIDAEKESDTFGVAPNATGRLRVQLPYCHVFFDGKPQPYPIGPSGFHVP